MRTENSLIWQKVLWSIVINFGITLFAYIKYTKSSGVIGFEIYSFVLSPYASAAGFIIILFRFWRASFLKSFLYVFIATVNIYLGPLGVYLNATSEVRMSFLLQGMFYLNILIAIFIFIDIFRNRNLK